MSKCIFWTGNLKTNILFSFFYAPLHTDFKIDSVGTQRFQSLKWKAFKNPLFCLGLCVTWWGPGVRQWSHSSAGSQSWLGRHYHRHLVPLSNWQLSFHLWKADWELWSESRNDFRFIRSVWSYTTASPYKKPRQRKVICIQILILTFKPSSRYSSSQKVQNEAHRHVRGLITHHHSSFSGYKLGPVFG